MDIMEANDKVLSLEALAEEISKAKENGLIVGLCHGCFDILHFGHLKHFEAAAKLVDKLIVTVTPDEFVNKGPHRPVFTAQQRSELIGGLSVVHRVGINKWPSAVETIKMLKPSCFIKGQEYETNAQNVNPGFFAEKEAIEAEGGKVVFTYEATSSSTSAFKRLTEVEALAS